MSAESAAPQRAQPLPASARAAATLALARQTTRFPDLLPIRPDDTGLSPRDAALAHAIYDAAVRRWLTLEHLLDAFAKPKLRRLEAPLRAVLLGAAAQALLLDRLPAYAIIDESVELAKRLVRPGAGGLVNAVLRRLIECRGERVPMSAADGDVPADRLPLSDGATLSLRAAHLPADPSERLSIACSLPVWLLDRWTAEHGPDTAKRLAFHSLAEPPIVLNVAHARPGPPRDTEPHDAPGSSIWLGTHAGLASALGPDVWVQDAASARAVAAAAHLRPSLVVDLCAGQGTKTRQLLATFPDARVIASDTDPERLVSLRAALAGHPRAHVADLHDLAGARADLVLLDVPCSNTGVLARRLEARYRAGPEQLRRLLELQRQIIAAGARLRAPSGRILYSTCSVERDENEGQARWAATSLGLRFEREGLHLPHGRPGGPPREYADGSYHALLA